MTDRHTIPPPPRSPWWCLPWAIFMGLVFIWLAVQVAQCTGAK